MYNSELALNSECFDRHLYLVNKWIGSDIVVLKYLIP